MAQLQRALTFRGRPLLQHHLALGFSEAQGREGYAQDTGEQRGYAGSERNAKP